MQERNLDEDTIKCILNLIFQQKNNLKSRYKKYHIIKNKVTNEIYLLYS